MSSRHGITALVLVASTLSTSAGAQAGARLLSVEGPITSYDVDGDIGFVGEYRTLKPGQHSLSFEGVPPSRLTVTMNVGDFGMRVVGTTISDVCADSSRSGDANTEVRAWPVEVVSNPKVNGASILRIGEPKLDHRTRALSPCPASRWAKQATWRLNVTSTPVGASIAAGNKYLAVTDARIEVPYGLADDGAEEDVHIRVYKPGFIGCTFLLGDLRKDKSNDVSCDLTSPEAPATPPSRP
jgi:hypothetical protein